MLGRIISTHIFLWLLSFVAVDGAVRFANYYQDHMVLQRAPQRAIVWGYSDTFDADILLTLNAEVYRTKTSSSAANELGESIWSVTLNPHTEDVPIDVQVTQPLPNGTRVTIILHDVLFGDVWVCSGQSNMEFTVSNMYNGSIEIANASQYPKIRLFTAARRQSGTPLEEMSGIALNWSVASAASVGSPFASAVCWLYGRMIHKELGGRPIGLIHSSWGGTPIEFWSPPEVLKECGIPRSGESDEEPMLDHESVGAFNRSDLYNAMIYPFTRMVITGVIWYQGESNTKFFRDKYNCTFPKMIENWRSVWHTRTNSATNPRFPFGFVQLSTKDATGKVVGGFPWIRWHQTFDVGYVPNNVVPNVFMAVALDLRDDARGIHPRDKLDVGYRLSRSGLAIAYGFKNVTYQGPVISNIAISSDSMQLNVTYSSVVSSRIELRNSAGFEVCCQDKASCESKDLIWVRTEASTIKDVPMTISLAGHDTCKSKPLAGIRYLWRETPCLFKAAAVYNGEDPDLPAPPYIHFF